MDIWPSITTDIIVFLITTGLIYYLNNFKKTIKFLTEKVGDLEIIVKKHSVNIKEITLLNSVVNRIDMKVRQSLEYIDKDDVVIQAFIQKQGEYARDCIEWAIHTQLKLTKAEISAKYESCNMEIRDLLIKTSPEFSNKVRPALIAISQHHINRVQLIVEDEFFNSKLDRFFTLTEQTVNEVLTTIVKGWIELKMETKKDERIL